MLRKLIASLSLAALVGAAPVQATQRVGLENYQAMAQKILDGAKQGTYRGFTVLNNGQGTFYTIFVEDNNKNGKVDYADIVSFTRMIEKPNSREFSTVVDACADLPIDSDCVAEPTLWKGYAADKRPYQLPVQGDFSAITRAEQLDWLEEIHSLYQKREAFIKQNFQK